MNEISRNFVGGAWLEAPGVVEDVNPSNTGDIVGRFAQADAAQTGAAIAAAKAAFPAWSRSGILQRWEV
ncbi:MAG TPA: aldehyde dehydrogenase family protein, partial [Beijerinckiaceae bacterium]|nr:aldehyde dehydrogenase family protein [Beijerinckiaceae bacterium]